MKLDNELLRAKLAYDQTTQIRVLVIKKKSQNFRP